MLFSLRLGGRIIDNFIFFWVFFCILIFLNFGEKIEKLQRSNLSIKNTFLSQHFSRQTETAFYALSFLHLLASYMVSENLGLLGHCPQSCEPKMSPVSCSLSSREGDLDAENSDGNEPCDFVLKPLLTNYISHNLHETDPAHTHSVNIYLLSTTSVPSTVRGTLNMPVTRTEAALAYGEPPALPTG